MLLSLVKGGWRGLVRLAEEGMGLWKRVIDKVVSILTWPFRKAFTETRSYVSSGWRYIRGEFSGGVGGIRAVLSRLLEVITYPYRAAFSAAKAIVRGAWHALHGDFSAMPGSIRNILGRIPGIVRGIFSGAGGWLLNAGSRIIHGLISGITGALGALRSKLSVVTKLIPKWKGPADVDRKLLTPNGHLVMDGFLRGLENRMPKIKASLGAFTSGLSKGLSGDRGSFRYAARATRSRPLLAGPAGSVGDGGIHVHLTVQGSVISERDLISKVRSGIAKAQRTAGKPATTR
jgi:phage-related protein